MGNVEQGLQVQVPKGAGEPTHLLLLRLGCDLNSLLPGCHQGDVEVQLRGAAAEDRWHEPPGHPDADAHEAVQGPEELLHCWVNIFLDKRAFNREFFTLIYMFWHRNSLSSSL